MPKIFVTTSRAHPQRYEQQAWEWAQRLDTIVVPRESNSNLEELCNKHQATGVVVVAAERVTYVEPHNGMEYFFHPNLASVRINNYHRNYGDHLVAAMDLKAGDEVLDCTMGRAADAILMSWVVGETGRIVGIEKIPVIAWLTIDGLQNQKFVSNKFVEAMRRIDARCADYMEFLPTCQDEEFDIVYFDPIFHAPIEEAVNMKDLRLLAEKECPGTEIIQEAIRVARRAVVIKQRFGTPLWEELGITRIHTGPRSRIEYGVIQK